MLSNNKSNLIIESLNNKFFGLSAIDEGTSVFSTKLNQFLKDCNADDETAKFVKSALNALFLGYGKEFGGYQEGKRPVIKMGEPYATMTMKFQTKEPTGYNFYNLNKKYFSKVRGHNHEIKIDGNSYDCVYMDINSMDDNLSMSGSKWDELYSPAKHVIVGIDSIADTKMNTANSLDKNYGGDTFRVIVSIPQVSSVNPEDNKFISKRGNSYTFSNNYKSPSNETYNVRYDMGSTEFSIHASTEGSYDTYNILYKPSRNAQKAFDRLVQEFGANTTRQEVESILSEYKIALKHSYWFNPYVD